MSKMIRIFKDGDKWCATYIDFVDLQTSPAGFGDTQVEAIIDLRKEEGGGENA